MTGARAISQVYSTAFMCAMQIAFGLAIPQLRSHPHLMSRLLPRNVSGAFPTT